MLNAWTPVATEDHRGRSGHAGHGDPALRFGFGSPCG